MSVSGFFDSHKDDYHRLISRCVPRYAEMLWALLDYLPQSLDVSDILELGCGTGNLSLRLAERFPDARIHLVDISAEMQDECRQRLGSSDRFVLEAADFRDLDYEPSAFDLVVSSISLHHLESCEKQVLFRSIHGWLRPHGIFSYSDQFSGETPDLYERHMQNWKREANALGSTSDDWDVWMQHQAEFDHHDSLPDQIDWLRDAGFPTVDCPWRFLLWTVLQARKCPPDDASSSGRHRTDNGR